MLRAFCMAQGLKGSGVSRVSRGNIYVKLTGTFYFLNTNFSNCTNAFYKKILSDPCDTWRLVSGVSRVSRGCV